MNVPAISVSVPGQQHGGVRVLENITPPGVAATAYPDEESWLKARRDYVTASNAAVICGVSSYKSKLALAMEMTSGEIHTSNMSERKKYFTHAMEPIIAQRACDELGDLSVVDPGGYTIWTNDAYPDMGATLDFVGYRKDRGFGVVQIKTHDPRRKTDWTRYLNDGTKEHIVPDDYLIQVQVEMACSGLPWAILAVFFSMDDMLIFEMDAKPEFHRLLAKQCSRFIDDLAAGIMPVADDSASSAKAIREAFPEGDGTTIDLGFQAYGWVSQMVEHQGIIDEHTTELNRLKNIVKQSMGTASQARGKGYRIALIDRSGSKGYLSVDEGLEQGLKDAGIPYVAKKGKSGSRALVFGLVDDDE